MTLFAAADTYAPGEPGTQGLAPSQGQNLSVLGRYHLDQLRQPNVWLGLGGLALVAFLVHKYGGRKR